MEGATQSKRGRKRLNVTDSAKKRKKREYQQRRRDQTIFIGDVIDDWNKLKAIQSLKTDEDLAKLLIERFSAQLQEQHQKKRKIASTPKAAKEGPHGNRHIVIQGSQIRDVPGPSSIVSEMSSCSLSSVPKSKSSGSIVSGMQELVELTDVDEPTFEMKGESVRIHVSVQDSSVDAGELHDSDDETFVPDPLDMSISVIHQEDSDVDDRDVIAVSQDLESEVHDIKQTKDNAKILELKDKLQSVDEDSIKEDMFLVGKSAIERLAGTKKCSKCQKIAEAKFQKTGACVIIQWVCEENHQVATWSSTPTLKYGVLLGNMRLSTAITLSGNNYQKVALLFRFMNVGITDKTTFHSVTSKYIVPAVKEYWENIRQSTLEEARATDIVVSGDGRMDSPGHCAHYCTYTMMNQATKEIIAMEVVDKRECQLKSSLMEATGFRRAMSSITEEGVNISECVTDAHPQITSIMKKEFSNIRHSWDMWHGAKNLGKKLGNVAHEKGNSALKPWVGSITNHFFHSAETCEGDHMTLKVKMASVLNHCADKHIWALGQCDHGPLEDDDRTKEWLDPRGNEMKALEKVIMDSRFMGNMKHYVTCQTTSELESLNNHLLMYASKRQTYSYPVYTCRCQLAAIDYMKHLQRPYKLNKKGEPCYHRRFSKAANNWSVCPVKVEKEYSYIIELMTDIINRYCTGDKKISGKTVMAESDPRRISKTIAPKSPPPTKELALKQKSRLEGKWKKPTGGE